MDTRLATYEDLPRLIEMGRKFFDASGYASIAEYDEQAVHYILSELVDKGTLVTDGKNGMLGFLTFPLFFDPYTDIAQELFWWVDPEARGSGLAQEMLTYAEELATETGAKAFIMLNLTDLDGDKVATIYKRNGYRSAEQNFIKAL